MVEKRHLIEKVKVLSLDNQEIETPLRQLRGNDRKVHSKSNLIKIEADDWQSVIKFVL